MSEEEAKEIIETDQSKADEVRKVYYDVKLRREPETDDFRNLIKMLLFALFFPTIISSVITLFFLPKPDVLFMLFIPMLIITLICLVWFLAFTFIGGKYAKLAWDLFLDKRKGIMIRWFKSNQVEIAAGKVDERVCFIPNDKLTEQTILEERLAGSANFMGRPVALMVQDSNFNVNPLHDFPSDPLNKDFNAAVQNSFDAGIFFNRVFEGDRLKIVLLILCVVGLFSIISLYFGWNASGQAQLANARIMDLNNSITSLIEVTRNVPQVFNG